MWRTVRSAFLVIVLAATAVSAQTPAAIELKTALARGPASAGGTWVAELYAARAYEPLWTDPRVAAELLQVIRAAALDGLNPEHYHLRDLTALAASPATPRTTAQLDLLRTRALMALLRDLRYGRARTVRERGSIAAELVRESDDVARLLGGIQSGRLAAAAAAWRPDHFVYQGLVRGLAELRAVQQAGGWAPLPEGTLLQRDSVDARVALLRHRMAVEGYRVEAQEHGAFTFDAALDAAVRSFQHRHGLNEDGVVGPATLRELNVPVDVRIEQVRANLERARWIAHDLPQSFLAVNIAGAKVYLVRSGEVIFETRAVVGATSTQTPVFRAALQHIELNPTWTVPPGIVHEILSALRRNPGYLRQNNMRVLDRSGRQINPANINFSAYSGRTFPYVFRQDAGPDNPLGGIKFVFPNRYNVYLHDTPARALLEREVRTFSHGCIRVQDPVRLGELLLGDAERWSRSAIEAAIANGSTRTIRLRAPLPVLILYWTAAADMHGELHYYADVYARDAALLAALDAP